MTIWQEQMTRLRDQLVSMRADQELFSETLSALRRQEASVPVGPPSVWFRHYARLYVVAQAIGIRRVVVQQRGSVALGGVLADLVRHPEALTIDVVRRQAQQANADLDVSERVVGAFQGEWFDAEGRLLVTKIQNDRQHLFLLVRGVKKWADKVAAHIDPVEPPPVATFADIHEAIAHTCEIFQNYSKLLSGGVWTEMLPILPAGQEELVESLTSALVRFRPAFNAFGR